MSLLVQLVFLSLFASVAYCARRDYSGYAVLRARAESDSQFVSLKSLHDGGKFDFWAGPSRHGVTDILVNTENRKSVEDFLNLYGIKYITHINDLERIISEQRASSATVQAGEMNWDDYQTIDTIYDWLDTLQLENPDLVRVSTIGKSTEGRDIKVVKIASSGSEQNKTAFWIDATIHAREWISTSTATYIINELVHSSADLLELYDFYVLPLINPDGYVYTHETDRLWRKTRSDHNSALGCRGVDANRNFGFHWGEAGSSSDKCSETYRGPEAYSEPEAEAVRNYITSTEANWHVFITLHSYSQLWMTPFGYSYDLPAGYDEMKRVGDLAAAKLESVHGTEYQVGSAANILYTSSGSSRDWAEGEGSFQYVYTIELRDTGNYGFILPKEQIIPTAEETWAGIQVVARNSK